MSTTPHLPNPSANPKSFANKATDTTTAKQTPVVLVHGIWNTAAIFNPLNHYLTRNGWQVHALTMTPNNGDALIEELAQQVASFVDASLKPQQPFNLIGYSIGGLNSRYYLQRLNGLSRVKKLIAISSPHQGTALALGSNRPGIQQMRPNSPFLNDLNRDIHQLQTVQVFSFWTPFDLLILPPWHSQLPIGQTKCLNIASHNKMIRVSKGLHTIAQTLELPRC